MNELIDKAMEITLALIRTNSKSEDVLRLSQSFLNLANGKRTLETGKTKGGSA